MSSSRNAVAARARLVRYLARQAERYADAVLPDQPPGTESGGDRFGRHETLLRTLVCEPWGRPGALPPHPPPRMRRWWLRLAVALAQRPGRPGPDRPRAGPVVAGRTPGRRPGARRAEGAA